MTREAALVERIRKLTGIGIALSAEHDLDRLLELIVEEARGFYECDAASLYIVDGDELVFRVAQNETLSRRRREAGLKKEPFRAKRLPLTRASLAGHVAITGAMLIIDDVYDLPPEAEYGFDRSWDEANEYRCRSMLLIPLSDRSGRSIGVLQLINRLDADGAPCGFDDASADIAHSLASQATIAIVNARLLEQMRQATLDTIFRLSVAAEYKDPDTAAHLERMSRYSAVVAREMKLAPDRVTMIRLAAPMHDIGKIGVPDAILTKPGKLTDDEYLEMKRHAEIGARILAGSETELLRLSEMIALTHHERYDGTGYPRGLKGEEIPIEGRIVSVADVFDALTTKRCYKPAFPLEDSLRILDEGRGNHFDPDCVDAFMNGLDEILEIKERFGD